MSVCKVCNNSFRLSRIRGELRKDIARRLKVCGNCQMVITDGNARNFRNDKKKVVKCVICKRDCNRMSVTPTCDSSSCRGKWLRNQKEIQMIEKFIRNDNVEPIEHLRLENIIGHGFEISIKKMEEE